jgi:hypothetical protein
MFFKRFGADKNVINVDETKLSFHTPQHNLHQTLKCCRGIA